MNTWKRDNEGTLASPGSPGWSREAFLHPLCYHLLCLFVPFIRVLTFLSMIHYSERCKLCVGSAYWRRIFPVSIMSTCSSCRDLLVLSICRKAARRIRMINESATSSDCFGYISVHTNEGFALEMIGIWNPENCHGMAFYTLTTPNM